MLPRRVASVRGRLSDWLGTSVRLSALLATLIGALDATAATSLQYPTGTQVEASSSIHIAVEGMIDPKLYEVVLVIGDIITAHCPHTAARSEFIRACLAADWHEAASMIEGMLAEPWHLKGRQEARLREFYDQLTLLRSDPERESP